MADDRVVQRVGQRPAHPVVAGYLFVRVGVFARHVRAVEVRENRRDLNFSHRRQFLGQRRDFLLDESQPVHPRVQLHMNRIVPFARMGRSRRKGFQRMEAVYFRFQPVGNHQLEAVGIGVEHHNRHRDAPFAQQHPFVGERHR